MSCEECKRVAEYMAADPEMYRGEQRSCYKHGGEHGIDGEALVDKMKVQSALLQASTALDDWTQQYASEFCDEARVEVAKKRIRERGGTLAYIADTRALIEDALATLDTK